MSDAHRNRAAERIPIELIEADFEIAFNLIDMCHAGYVRGDRASASRALHDAEDVFQDIEQRLAIIGSVKSHPFDPLVGELKREIALARSEGT